MHTSSKAGVCFCLSLSSRRAHDDLRCTATSCNIWTFSNWISFKQVWTMYMNPGASSHTESFSLSGEWNNERRLTEVTTPTGLQLCTSRQTWWTNQEGTNGVMLGHNVYSVVLFQLIGTILSAFVRLKKWSYRYSHPCAQNASHVVYTFSACTCVSPWASTFPNVRHFEGLKHFWIYIYIYLYIFSYTNKQLDSTFRFVMEKDNSKNSKRKKSRRKERGVAIVGGGGGRNTVSLWVFQYSSVPLVQIRRDGRGGWMGDEGQQLLWGLHIMRRTSSLTAPTKAAALKEAGYRNNCALSLCCRCCSNEMDAKLTWKSKHLKL